jgi:hypothetical protein
VGIGFLGIVSLFCWSMNLGMFFSLPYGSCTNLLLGGNGFHPFSFFPSLHLVL